MRSLTVALPFVLVACTTSREAAPRASAPITPEETDADEQHEHEMSSKTRDVVDADGVVRRGQPLSTIEATPVSIAIAKASELEGKHVKLAGTVNKVCSETGCWFVMQGDKADDAIRISTRAKDIFVPAKAVGMKALVEGTLEKKNGSITVDVVGLEMHPA